MENKYVIKNLNNNGYYKGREYVDWTKDIDSAAKFDNLGSIKDEIDYCGQNGFDMFDGITFQVISVYEVNL